jgi:competence protein ComEA
MVNKYIGILAVALLVTLSFGTSSLIASGHGTAASAASDMAGKAAGMMDKLNINTASIESLAKIPGLDQKIGEAIAAYREANGAFKSLSDLANIEGIDAGLLEKIKPFLTL